jgi:hypothetical protein
MQWTIGLASLAALTSLAACGAEPEIAPTAVEPPRDPPVYRLADDAYTPTPWSEDRDADNAPFAPRAAPDHVVVMEAPGANTRRERRTVRSHGGWARVESSDLHGAGTHYVSLRDPVSVSFTRGPDERYASIGIRLNSAPYGDNPPPVQRTGERDSLLGETCMVWDITARVMRSSSREARWLSCITDDGIELWHRYEGEHGYRSEMRAVSLRREPVAAADVTPPADLLDPARWPVAWPPAETSPSVEVWMDNGAIDEYRQEKRVRQVGAIQRTDERDRITIVDRTRNTWVAFNRDRAGRYEGLATGRYSTSPGQDRVRLADKPDIRFGDERCAWFDMTPGTADYSKHACLTAEGLPLAETTRSWGSLSLLKPSSVIRDRLGPDEVGLPAAVLDPQNWGLPARR